MTSIASFGQRISAAASAAAVASSASRNATTTAAHNRTSVVVTKSGQQQQQQSNTPPALENCEDNGGVDVDYVNNFDDATSAAATTTTTTTTKTEAARGDEMHNAESQLSAHVLNRPNAVGPDGKKTLELGLDKFKTSNVLTNHTCKSSFETLISPFRNLLVNKNRSRLFSNLQRLQESRADDRSFQGV